MVVQTETLLEKPKDRGTTSRTTSIMREQWPSKMAEYNSCCSNQSFSGLITSPFKDYQIFQKTINKLCFFQISQPFPNTNTNHPSNKQTNPTPYRSHPTDEQTNTMHNKIQTTEKQTNPTPYRSHPTDEQTQCTTELIPLTNRQTQRLTEVTPLTNRQTQCTTKIKPLKNRQTQS